MTRLVALGFALIVGFAAVAARPAAAEDRLSPFLGDFQGQTGPAPGSLYVPLWSKPTPFDLTLARRGDELVFAVGDAHPVILRFVPVSGRFYLLRTNRDGGSGYAWVDGDDLTIECRLAPPGETAHGMRFVVSLADDERRLAAYTWRGDDEPVEVLDTGLRSADD